jgi:putative Ca2+/H+ antiporter (TMEM165/GDT1 family)
MDVGPALTAFVVVLPAELPDKTLVATLVLATRFRPLAVWVGVTAAFAVQCAIAVLAGGLLSLLPRTAVLLASATLFAVGAALMLRAGLAGRAGADAATVASQEPTATRAGEAAAREPASFVRAAAASFVVLFAAEWGDLSQLITAGLAARYDAPLAVWAGALLALSTVAAVAVVAGRWLQARVRLDRVRFLSAGLLALLAGATLAEAVASAA